MNLLGRCSLRWSLSQRICLKFSQQNQQTKIETVSFKKNVINDFNKIAYEPEQNLQFINGKSLIYKNQRSKLTILLQSMYYWVPLVGIGYTIYINPFANFFPAAIPILAILQLAILKLWFNKIKWNQNIVSQIYLLQNGQATQIWFANSLKRRMFGEEQSKIYYNSIFVNPNFQKQEVILLNKNQRVFPQSIKQSQKTNMGYAWVKYFSNGDNFLVIPKKSQYNNMKVLIQIFKGKLIKNKIR